MKIFLTAATVWTGIVIALIPAPAIAVEEIAPVEIVQEVTAVEHSEEIAPRDEITVTAPSQEIVQAVEIVEPEIVEAVEVIAPESEIVEPVTVEAEEIEIGHVAPHYILEPCIHEDGSGQVACYWDAASRENGEGASFVMLEGVFYYSE